jgi:hypothetical protein
VKPSGEVEITQLLLLKDQDVAEAAGRALWLALQEVGRLFSGDLEESGPLEIPLSEGTVHVAPVFTDRFAAPIVPEGIGASATDDKLIWTVFAEAMAGSRTCDQRKLANGARVALGIEGTMLLVTEQAITPSPGLRYLIWDPVYDGAVLSTATLDPSYWGRYSSFDKDRVAVMKRRTRAACITVVGAFLGLYRCDNPRCFLYGNVDSVTRLDEFVQIGPEHGIEQLTGRGFSFDSDPNELAPVVRIDEATAGWVEGSMR